MAKFLNSVKLVVLALFPNHLQKYQVVALTEIASIKVSCSYKNCISKSRLLLQKLPK